MKLLVAANTSSKWKVRLLLSRKSKQREREGKPSGMIRVKGEVKGGGKDKGQKTGPWRCFEDPYMWMNCSNIIQEVMQEMKGF